MKLNETQVKMIRARATEVALDNDPERWYKMMPARVVSLCDLALQALEQAWQPIETAPKDGTWVLAYRPGIVEHARCQVLKWDDYEENWAIPGMAAVSRETPPTHWQPLPSAPRSLGEG